MNNTILNLDCNGYRSSMDSTYSIPGSLHSHSITRMSNFKNTSILPYSTSDFSNSSNHTTDSEDEVDSTTSYKRSNRTFTPPYIIGALTTIYLSIVLYGYLNPL